ncbi:MAG: hypothetical protein AAF678_12695 [Pseudomonadota bacterium]
MSSNALRPKLDRAVYSGSADQLAEFYGALPQDSVRGLALEGFRRLAERRKSVIAGPQADAANETIERLSLALISSNGDACMAEGEALLNQHSVEKFYLVYVSGAAERLGHWWHRDQISFVDVTVGLGRLHALVRSIEQPIRSRPTASGRKSAIFATAPGERHTLGVTMATDLFRRRGWHILLLVGLDHEALMSRIARADASALGVSAAGEHAALPLARLLVDLRIARPDCRVFISGQIVTEARTLVESVMPDGIAQTVEDADGLLNAFMSSEADATDNMDHRH